MFRHLLFSSLALAVLSAAAYSQTASPTPPVKDDEGDVVKISTDLVRVDVTVTNSKGEPITDLRRDEVVIEENGKKQDITSFSFINGSLPPKPKAEGKVDRRAVLPPAHRVRAEDVRRTIALVVDDLNLSFESSAAVRRTLNKYVDEQVQDGDLVAIVRTGGGIGALQQFTTDKRQLYAAIAKLKFNLAGTSRLNLFGAGPQPSGGGLDGADPKSNEDIANDLNDFRQSVFTTGTLGAIDFVIRGMSQLPGRKSIVLLSDGFPLPLDGYQAVDMIKQLADHAHRASVVVYTIDAKGLTVPGLGADYSSYGKTGDEIASDSDRAADASRASSDGLRFLATQTGGFAIFNQNDLTRGIQRVLNDQSYYLVGFEPSGDTFDPRTRRYNRLSVKVTRPGAKVRYRSGFFGVSEEQIAASKPQGDSAILNALTSPFAMSGVSVKMSALYTNGEKDKPFMRTFLNIDPADLTFEKLPGDKRQGNFDIVAVTFGENGTVVDESSRNFTLELSDSEYQKLLKRGIVSSFTLGLKKPGGYQLRVAIRDTKTGNVGSANQFVEVPNLKKNRLTLSGVILESFPLDTWRKMSTFTAEQIAKASDPQYDTAIRQFRAGSILRYAYELYNVRPAAADGERLTYRVTLYNDDKEVYKSDETPLRSAVSAEGSASAIGTLRLGSDLPAGDYILRITATDKYGKEKKNTADQFVQFEIVE